MTLTHSQRTRLIRSTRKIGALLGETPSLTISESSEATDDSESAKGIRHKRSVSLRCHPTSNLKIPIPPPLPHTLDSPQRSPLSPTFGPLNRDSPYCPPSPTTELPDSSPSNAIELRRKKMAKLARTFGENVPVELIAAYDTKSSKPKKRSDDDEPALPPSKVESDQYSSTICIAQSSDASPSSPASSVSSPEDAPAFPPGLEPKQTSLKTLPARSSSLRVKSQTARVRVKHNYSTSENQFPKELQRSNVGDVDHDHDRDLAFAKLTLTDRPPGPSLPKNRHVEKAQATYRRQNGWSGEWNHDDMNRVMKELRSLK